jgi:GTP-binding protein
MTFSVAIVGRPNVGKSTLFNRLVGKRLALVDDLPGVTRDRREGAARLGDLAFTAIDTAGLEETAPESLTGRMRAQTEAAIAAADAVLFMIDARTGPVPVDRAFADLVRRSGKPAILVANKSEGRAAEAGIGEAYALGLGEPVPISAEHGEGMADLYQAVRAALPAETAEPAERRGRKKKDDAAAADVAVEADFAVEEAAAPATIRVAIIGRPNTGKSTLINRLLGEERLLTGPEAGITRDSIAVDVDWRGRTFKVHDTAGLRRRSRIEAKLEKLSVSDTLNAVRFAEVVVVLMDSQAPFEEQDLRIADLVEREGRAVVIGMNKWDLVESRPGAMKRLREETDHWLPQLKGVPVVAVSGMTGAGLDRLMQAMIDAHAVWNRRAPTAALNRWLSGVISAHPPPAVSGRRIRLDYVTQPKARPPTFVLFTSRADKVPDQYKRYLVNSLRETFDLPGTPLRLTLREKANPYAKKKKKR